MRALFERAEKAVEAKDLGTFKLQISETYIDSNGNDRRAIEGLVRYYFLRNQSLHLFVRVQNIVFPAPDRAEALLYVAMAGERVDNAQDLNSLQADFHRFEVMLLRVDNDDWKVTRAEWRRAELTDFL